MHYYHDTYLINLHGLDIEVLFHYYPPEKKIMYCKDGSGYPGSGPDIYITQIKHAGIDIMDFIDHVNLISELRDIISEKFINE